MSVPKKSFTGKPPSAPTHPQAPPPTPTADTSQLLKGVRPVRAGPGTSRINLSRSEVEQRMDNYRQQKQATNQESLWQRLTNIFVKSRKSE